MLIRRTGHSLVWKVICLVLWLFRLRLVVFRRVWVRPNQRLCVLANSQHHLCSRLKNGRFAHSRRFLLSRCINPLPRHRQQRLYRPLFQRHKLPRLRLHLLAFLEIPCLAWRRSRMPSPFLVAGSQLCWRRWHQSRNRGRSSRPLTKSSSSVCRVRYRHSRPPFLVMRSSRLA